MVLIHHAFQDLTDLPPLTPDERRSPFAKYYQVPVQNPAPEILEALAPDAPMEAAAALPLAHIDRLFDPNDPSAKNGWCLLDDGTAYSSVTIDMPDLTEKEYFLFVIFVHMNTLNYKVWLPKMHLQQGQFTIKDVGWGPLLLHPHWTVAENKFRNPVGWFISQDHLTRAALIAAGIDPDHPRSLDPDFISFTGGPMTTIDTATGERLELVKLYYVRRLDQGLQIRVCIWMGATLEEDGRPRLLPGPNKNSISADRISGLAANCAFEWTRANDLGRDICRDWRHELGTIKMGSFFS